VRRLIYFVCLVVAATTAADGLSFLVKNIGNGAVDGAAVSVSPGAVTLYHGESTTFTATVVGTTDPSVAWSASCGSITAGGVYTAPLDAEICVVTATSVEDPGMAGEAYVTVLVPAFAFLPPSGAGIGSLDQDFCTTHEAQVTDGFCLAGDGTISSNTLGLAAVGTPTSQTDRICPNGTTCASVTSQRIAGTANYYATATQASPSGDFSVAGFVRNDGATGHVLGKNTGTNSASISFFAGATTTVNLVTSDGTTTSTCLGPSITAGTNVAFVIQFTRGGGAADSIAKISVSGAATVTCSTMRPPQALAASGYAIGQRGSTSALDPFAGVVGPVLFTQTAVSDAVRDEMLRGLAAPVEGTRGEVLTDTRSTIKTCLTADGNLGSRLGLHRPCLSDDGAITVHASHSNRAARSEEFDLVAWAKTNTTVTANTHVSPAGTLTADTLTSTASGGLVESTAFTTVGAVGFVTLWAWTPSGTQDFDVVMRDTTAGVDRGSCALTATTTVTRHKCYISGLTAANNHVTRIYPGGAAGTGTIIAWGHQYSAQAGYIASDVPWPYCLSVTSAATCSGDLYSSPSTGFPVSAGVLAFDFASEEPQGLPTGGRTLVDTRISASDSGYTLSLGTNGSINTSWRLGASSTSVNSGALSWTVGTSYRVRVVWGSGNVYVYRDGTLIASNTTGTVQVPDAINANVYFGANFTGTTGTHVVGRFKNICADSDEAKCP
jgi:hypothetical protein